MGSFATSQSQQSTMHKVSQVEVEDALCSITGTRKCLGCCTRREVFDGLKSLPFTPPGAALCN
jgi:hypothetical protein